METEEVLQESKEQILEKLDQKSGYDFYQYGLKLDENLRKTEAQREIERLQSQKIKLTDQEIRQLTDNAPPVPEFDVKSKQEVDALGHFPRKRYNRKVNAYKEDRESWEESEQGRIYKETKQGVLEREEKKRAREEAQRKKDAEIAAITDSNGQPLYTEIQANPKSMDEALDRMSEDANFNIEKGVAKNDVNELLAKQQGNRLNLQYAFTAYVNQAYTPMNYYKRTGKKMLHHEYTGIPLKTGQKAKPAEYSGYKVHELANILDNALSETAMSRDVVVRRGVNGFGALQSMMGATEALTIDQIKEKMKGEVILTDKGFVSTAMRSTSGFYAGHDATIGPKEELGIEFVILVKKGTHAIDISSANFQGQDSSEEELIIAPNTKFRVVRAFFNDGSDEKKEGDGENSSKVLKGHSKSWKIYLETIPPAEDGELR